MSTEFREFIEDAATEFALCELGSPEARLRGEAAKGWARCFLETEGVALADHQQNLAFNSAIELCMRVMPCDEGRQILLQAAVLAHRIRKSS